MPDLDLDALEALLKRASPGEWSWTEDRDGYPLELDAEGVGILRPGITVDPTDGRLTAHITNDSGSAEASHPDFALIVALRNAAPALIAAARERDELRDRAEKAERERDEARETNRRLNRRCQRSEALPKFHELGLADELRSAVWHLRYRYRCAASAARSIERMWADNSASHYANLIREWAGKGRPPNHTLSHFDSIVDEMRADKAALAAATSRAEKAEKERDEAATAAKVKADLLATATAALGDATARAERADAEMRKREERA